MPIKHLKGGVLITGDSIGYARLLILRTMVSLEAKGIKVRRGPVVWKRVQKEFNIKGKREDVLAWLNAKIEECVEQQEHIVDGKRFVNGKEVM